MSDTYFHLEFILQHSYISYVFNFKFLGRLKLFTSLRLSAKLSCYEG